MAEQSILIIGAGELGMAMVDAFVALAKAQTDGESQVTISVLLRPAQPTSSTSAAKQAQLQHLHSLGIHIVTGDTETDSETQLSATFKPFNTVVHAGGMTASPGTQTKITRAVLAAGVGLYIPWQFGVDYDIIGKEGGFGLFAEQFGIREMLRSQTTTEWIIVSCGIFTSFLFEDGWGVVRRLKVEADDGGDGKIQVTALNSWDDWITATTAKDIARCTAALVLDSAGPRNRAVYIAGDTLTYKDFADVVERETGQEVEREVWPLEELKERAKRDPDNKLRKYHVVFSEGKGLSWPKEETWSFQNGVEMQDVAGWIRENWR